jgi:helicase
MVSWHYAKQMTEPPPLPVLIDSGGFASLFDHSSVRPSGKLGILHFKTADAVEVIHPKDVLDLQERYADIAFPLDFPIPPGMEVKHAHQRQRLTIANAYWALANRRQREVLLFACVQAWDVASAKDCARAYAGAPFDGVAIGGLVPRARDLSTLLAIVETVRNEIGERPLHVFGLGKPEIIEALFRAGVDSVDSSSYVKLAADGRLWSNPARQIDDPTPTDRLHLALCNLAYATGSTLPLSATRLVFTTHALVHRAAASTTGSLSHLGDAAGCLRAV